MRGGPIAFGLLGLMFAAGAAAQTHQPPPGSPSAVQKQCADAAEVGFGPVTLPHAAKALRDRKRLKVLAIGATPLNERDQTQGHYARVEKVLETNFKGVDVEIIDRGVSGEIARDGAERIKTEVALVEPDLVFWQVGVADALALTPAGELKATLSRTVVWLKEHNVDVVLIGLKYQRSLAGNEGFQRIRKVIRDVVREHEILRVGHYESIEAIDRLRRQEGETASELDLSDAGSNCLADFLSRALAVGLFAKPRGDRSQAPAPVDNATAPGPPTQAPVSATTGSPSDPGAAAPSKPPQ